MTVLSRGARVRRGGRRPGWLLLTAMLVLAIAASSALVFTDQVELLKLAVILALWAAVVGAFVSVLYRRQSDVDQARARDLKLVYDLQLDREVSARREYELTVETQLRRDLAAELRAESADQVGALRAELAALRSNLEILFDADLDHRPALETERTATRAYSDWDRGAGTAPPDRVSSSRVTTVGTDASASPTVESSIIDVPEEPLMPPRQPAEVAADERAGSYGGSHRLASEGSGRPSPEPRDSQPEPGDQPEAQPVARQSPPAEPVRPHGEWNPVSAEGQWLPPGSPGSNWISAPSDDSRAPAEDPRPGRHWRPSESVPTAPDGPEARRHHGVSGGVSGGASGGPAAGTAQARQSGEFENLAPPPTMSPASQQAPRHRSPEESGDPDQSKTGGQTVAEMLARLLPGPAQGGRRRRRED